jgi:DNA-binding CsgD family transcriptional regulator
MARAATVDFRLRALAELLEQVHAAPDLYQVAQALTAFLKGRLPGDSRMRGRLKTLERRLLMALEDLFLAELHPDGPPRGLEQRMDTARDYYAEQIEAAALLLDQHGEGADPGAVLRAAAPAVASAAVSVLRRGCTLQALEIARDQEGLGAAPSLLYQLDGRLLWTNRALTELMENRGLSRQDLQRAADRFAAPLCAALRKRQDPSSQSELRRRVIELGVHLRAAVKRSRKVEGTALLLVEVSEARRAIELSPRELQVARLVAQHGAYSKVAEIAGLGLDSVRTYVRRIYRKYGVGNRVQLKARLIREGLLPFGT